MDRLDELLRRFEAEYMQPNSITAPRRAHTFRTLRELDATLDHPLDELTAAEVSTYIGSKLQAGRHPNTARWYLGMVRSFVTWAGEACLIDGERLTQLKSVRNPRGSSGHSSPKPYKIAEVREFYSVLSAKYPALPTKGRGSYALKRYLAGTGYNGAMRKHLWRHARRLQFEAQIALALEQGLRRIELFNLSIPAMHYDNDELVVLTAKQGPGREVHRAIPYTTHARMCTQEWLDFRALLIPGHEFPWLSLDQAGTRAAQVAPQRFPAFGQSLRCFGDTWEWHRFRHTCATEWLRSKVPLEKVRVFMGHATIDQTLAYTQIVQADVSEAFGEAEADFARRLGVAA